MRLLWLLCAVPALALRAPREPSRFEYRQVEMGVVARIVLYAPDESAAREAARAAFARVAALDSIMSDYRPESELMRLSARSGGPPVRVSEELFHLLSLADSLSRVSDGAFDVTAGPLVRLWRRARRTGTLPTEAERREAMSRVGWRHLHLDPAARTVRLDRPGMLLDLGGIAKGYAAQEAVRTLARQGVSRALVEMGGDLVASAPPPGRRGWRVRIDRPGRTAPDSLLLAHAALSTSGDTEQFVEIDGVRYSHVVDPATGVGLRTRVAATVLAPDGATADALSTLLTVLGPAQGRALLAARFPGVTAWVRIGK
jgi:thiamine biosynthesis lipoprotein